MLKIKRWKENFSTWEVRDNLHNVQGEKDLSFKKKKAENASTPLHFTKASFLKLFQLSPANSSKIFQIVPDLTWLCSTFSGKGEKKKKSYFTLKIYIIKTSTVFWLIKFQVTALQQAASHTEAICKSLSEFYVTEKSELLSSRSFFPAPV